MRFLANLSNQVGEGAALAEGDQVMPLRANMGTWRSLAVWRARDLIRMPPDALPVRTRPSIWCCCCPVFQEMVDARR